LKFLQAQGESELKSKLKSKSASGKKDEEKKATNQKHRFIHDVVLKLIETMKMMNLTLVKKIIRLVQRLERRKI
jgi:hypothetical protein